MEYLRYVLIPVLGCNLHYKSTKNAHVLKVLYLGLYLHLTPVLLRFSPAPGSVGVRTEDVNKGLRFLIIPTSDQRSVNNQY